MTQKSFELALAKGEIGERVVREHLEKHGWSVFMPVTEGAHHFDILATLNKERAIAMDVKSKPRMNMYHATGVNQKHFEEYKSFSERHNMPFWIVFVDEQLGTIYGNSLDDLEAPRQDSVDGRSYPRQISTAYGTKLRLWSLESMRHLGFIDRHTRSALESMSQGVHAYAPLHSRTPA